MFRSIPLLATLIASQFSQPNESLYTPDFLRKLGPGGYAYLFRGFADQVKTDEPLDRLLYVDSKLICRAIFSKLIA